MLPMFLGWFHPWKLEKSHRIQKWMIDEQTSLVFWGWFAMICLQPPTQNPKQEAGHCSFDKALVIFWGGYSNDTMDMKHCDRNMESLLLTSNANTNGNTLIDSNYQLLSNICRYVYIYISQSTHIVACWFNMLINGPFKILLPWKLSELLPLQMRYDNLNKSQITGKANWNSSFSIFSLHFKSFVGSSST